MRVVRLLLVCVALAAAIGCSSKDEAGPAPAAGGAGMGDDIVNGSAGAPAENDACHDGCVATLAAACEHGPADQLTCEEDCRGLATGACSTEYRALQRCAKGQSISCAAGYPVVAACATEQATFVACENR